MTPILIVYCVVMFPLHEPQWGIDMLFALHDWMQASDVLTLWLPIIADVFVFVYPVYLVVVYLYGIWHHENIYKESALYVWLAAFFTVCVNIMVQSFVIKERPDVVLDVLDSSRDSLLLNQYLPTSTFPSDHAGVSMAVAMATIAWGIHYKKKWYIYFGLLLVVISLMMSVARIAVAVHWPTDIIAGVVFGAVVPMILLWSPVWWRTKKRIVHPLMKLQVWLWGVVGLKG